MAKLVYAMDLKSIGRNSPCRFESGSRHQQIVRDVLDPNRIAQCVRPGARRGMSMPQPANDHFVPAACTTRPSYDAQQQNPARTERLEQQSLAVNVVSALHIVCSKVSQCRRKAWIALDCRPESAALGLGLAQLSPGIRQFVIGVGAPPRHDSALKRVSGQQPVAAFNVQVSETQMSLVPGYGSRVDFENPFQLLPGLLRPSPRQVQRGEIEPWPGIPERRQSPSQKRTPPRHAGSAYGLWLVIDGITGTYGNRPPCDAHATDALSRPFGAAQLGDPKIAVDIFVPVYPRQESMAASKSELEMDRACRQRGRV